LHRRVAPTSDLLEVLSDLVSLFGYRRKSYLIANVVAAAAYLWRTIATVEARCSFCSRIW
jgi:hypothetical protein